MRSRDIYLRGSMTIEITYMIPLLMMLLIFSIRGAFYFHDKNVVMSAAYETVAIASTKMREEKKITEEEIARIFQNRINEKCLLFVTLSTDVSIGEEILLCVKGTQDSMGISMELKSNITEPEKTVRKMQILKRQVGMDERRSTD